MRRLVDLYDPYVIATIDYEVANQLTHGGCRLAYMVALNAHPYEQEYQLLTKYQISRAQ